MRRDEFLAVRQLMSIVALSGGLLFVSIAAPVWGSPKSYPSSAVKSAAEPATAATDVLDDLDSSPSEMRPVIERYSADQASLERNYPIDISPVRSSRFKRFYTEWLDRLRKLNFDAMGVGDRVDYLLFKNELDYELQQLDIESKQLAEMEPLIPFAQKIVELEETRRRMEPVNSQEAAGTLDRIKEQIQQTQKQVEAGVRPPGRSPDGGEENVEPIKVKKTVAFRVVRTIQSLRNTLRSWFGFYNGYDPLFTWWVDEPYKELDQALTNYAAFLSERVVGVPFDRSPAEASAGRRGGQFGEGAPGGGPQRPGGQAPRPVQARPGDTSDIIGDPIGRDALMVELAHEMIPYTPEELIAIGRKELAWCEAEMVRASREIGYGDDWHKALEHVKDLYVEPGKQPEVIRDLALEAIKFLKDHDLITVPPLAEEIWRMQMMSPERQLVNPFFTGGETISVSYPTNTMSHEQKLMSMRGNNPHFSRATVHHELIAGHHLQGFMSPRYKAYRRVFSTPFWGEGWALYWELLLWDQGFVKTPEDRIGMLFWRMHRCARIIFSLSFHLGQMTPQEAIDFLVDRVGHERENAVAEVRRSVRGAPLYQAAYMLGGLQFRDLHRELVDSKKMTNRAFHDTILRENRMPVEMVRAILTQQKLGRDFKSSWKFYGPNPGSM